MPTLATLVAAHPDYTFSEYSTESTTMQVDGGISGESLIDKWSYGENLVIPNTCVKSITTRITTTRTLRRKTATDIIREVR